MSLRYNTFVVLLFSICIALALALPVVNPGVGSTAEAAVSASCKKKSKIVYNNLRARVVNKSGSPTYVARSWFRGCAEKDGFRIYEQGAGHTFPKGSNPKKLGYTGTKVTNRYYPGGSVRTVIAPATSSRSVMKAVAVNIFLPELIAPPQPHLSRLASWDSQLTSMWGGGRKDIKRRQQNSLRY